MSNNANSDVVQSAKQIEALAKDIQDKLNNNEDILATANELSRNSLTFVFMVGALYEQKKSSQVSTKKTVKASVVKGPRNYHNVRNSLGQFARV